MPKSDRLFELIDYLEGEPRSTNSITKELGISLPTAYRYIKNLRKQGYEIDFRGKNYHLLAKPGNQSTDIKPLFVPKDMTISQNIVEKLTHGINFGLPAEMKYKKPTQEEASKYLILPINIVMMANRYYLIAKDTKDNINKEFRIDRVEEVKISHSVKRIDKDMHDVKFVIRKKLAPYYDGQFPDAKVVEKKNGDLEISIKVHSIMRAKILLFPYMEMVEVIEPKELRNEMRNTLIKMLEMYF